MCENFDKYSVVLKNVSKSFDDEMILKSVDLELEKGKFYTLLGPSGCGKTTILNLIAGFLDANSGEIYINGENVLDVPASKRKVNTVFQNYSLFPHMNVFDNVAFGLEIKKTDKKIIKKEVEKALDMVNLSGFEKREISQMSGGQRQRVALARSLVLSPKLLLLDEPLSNLDQKLRVSMRLLIKNIQKNLGTTMIFVTHDQNEAFELADDIILMNKGKIEQHSYPLDIYKNPKNNFVLNFIGDKNIFEGYYVRPEDVKISDQGEDGIIKDIVFQGSSVKVEIQLDDKTIDSYMLNNDFKNEIGDKVKVIYSKRKLPTN